MGDNRKISKFWRMQMDRKKITPSPAGVVLLCPARKLNPFLVWCFSSFSPNKRSWTGVSHYCVHVLGLLQGAGKGNPGSGSCFLSLSPIPVLRILSSFQESHWMEMRCLKEETAMAAPTPWQHQPHWDAEAALFSCRPKPHRSWLMSLWASWKSS